MISEKQAVDLFFIKHHEVILKENSLKNASEADIIIVFQLNCI